MSIKKKLYTSCQSFVDDRIKHVQNAIENAQNSSNSETKSTAGDKHDTARAMMQLEVEKLSKQLAEAKKLRIGLSHINPESAHKEIQMGSVVETNAANYFISVSAGNISVKDLSYFAISPVTPIAKLMIGLKKGEHFTFNGKTIEILSVS